MAKTKEWRPDEHTDEEIIGTRTPKSSKKCLMPTITLRRDGVVIFYHENGSAEHIDGKMSKVMCVYGGVFLLEEKPSGRMYRRKIRHVQNCAEAAARIIEITAQR